MAWQTPKTNWTPADGVADADFNRIEGNIQELQNTKINTSEKGAANGVATLDSGGKIPDAQIPASIARDSELSAHTSDSTIHVTSADKTNWNGKANQTDLQNLEILFWMGVI